MTTRPINGTQKADVYSFAIILQEIIFRATPYFAEADLPQCQCISHFSIFLFKLRSEFVTRGHPYKIVRRNHSCTARSSFFSERVTDIWNTSLLSDVVDFPSLASFKRSSNSAKFLKYLVD